MKNVESWRNGGLGHGTMHFHKNTLILCYLVTFYQNLTAFLNSLAMKTYKLTFSGAKSDKKCGFQQLLIICKCAR